MSDLKVIDGKGDAAENVIALVKPRTKGCHQRKGGGNEAARLDFIVEIEPDMYDLDRAARLAECAWDDDELYRFAAEQLCDRARAVAKKYLQALK